MLLLLPLALLWGRAGGQQQRRPWAAYSLKVPEVVTVQEGLCVHVPCSFSYPSEGRKESGPISGYWFRDGANTNHDAPVATNNRTRQVQEETRGRFDLPGVPMRNNCSLSISNATRSDHGLYFFKVEKGQSIKWNYVRNKLSVRVTALTPNILLPGTLEYGHTRNLTCSVPWTCEKGLPPKISWAGPAVVPQGPTTGHSSVLTLVPQLQHHGTNLTCQVTLPGTDVTGMRTVHLNVSYSPQNLTVTVLLGSSTAPTALRNGSSLSVLEGQSLHLACDADSNPPAKLNWNFKSLTLSPSQPSDPGLLKLPQVQLRHEGEYTCQAQNPLGSQHVSLILLLQSEHGPLNQGEGWGGRRHDPESHLPVWEGPERGKRVWARQESEVPQEEVSSDSSGYGGCGHCRSLIPQVSDAGMSPSNILLDTSPVMASRVAPPSMAKAQPPVSSPSSPLVLLEPPSH
ncbi:sialic acid-binding Ig-like lectin 13 isoform X3 [Nycticebus coucang]|uniref:sialic acid-binding Ig-like lectin 13 isoform X3 n=1 Tax=Nycticebus coucang TaxID=9470 RepID=UPI00234D73AF|nr:sialic acid-binding Ig-like lectin 13 isoform X3 [Nycticebus coucang]XP_053463200.1 sialic acid-binding Ig-like lectin 13 isoform X3 [Nycticebus coucang]